MAPSISCIRGVALAQGMASAETFDATMERARQDITKGRFIWPMASAPASE